jgi:hypothetical protein
MEATIREPSAGAMVLALLMLLFGSLMFLFGYFALDESQSERFLAKCLPIGGSHNFRVADHLGAIV